MGHPKIFKCCQSLMYQQSFPEDTRPAGSRGTTNDYHVYPWKQNKWNLLKVSKPTQSSTALEKKTPSSRMASRKATRTHGPSSVLENHADENLHLRSPNFIKKMIEREFVILMECEDGTVGAYLEIYFFISYGGN